MKISAERIDELIDQANGVVGLLDEIQGTLAAVQTDENGLSVIRELFTTELSKTWLELDPRLSSQNDWQVLELVVKDMQNFFQDFYKAVLSPRRAKLEARLGRWLAKWSVKRKAALDRFLRSANEQDLTYLDELVEEIEPIEINDNVIQQQLTKWLSHQVKQLAQREKEVAYLETWLEHIRDVVLEVSGLDEFLETTARSIEGQDDDILQLIGNKWLDAQRKHLTSINTEQDNPGYASWEETASGNWRDVDRALPTLKLSLNSVDADERNLVSRHIEDWDPPDASAIEGLIDQLRDLIKTRQQIQETRQLQNDGSSLAQPAIGFVQDLWDNRPTIPVPLQGGNLAGYIGKLRQAANNLETWLETYESVSDQLGKMYSRWKELAAKHNLQEAIKDLEAVDLGMETLASLVRVHNSLVRITERIRQELIEELPEDEKEVLGVILQRIGAGQDRLDVIDLKSNISHENYIELLARLTEKNLVRLEVTT